MQVCKRMYMYFTHIHTYKTVRISVVDAVSWKNMSVGSHCEKETLDDTTSMVALVISSLASLSSCSQEGVKQFT